MSEWSSTEFKKKARIIPYDRLPFIKDIEPGTFVFSDLDRLNSFQLKVLEDFCEQLESADKSIPIINHPRFVLCRHDLLRRLYDKGINMYNVYPAVDKDSEPRYPMFLRMENDHKGPLSKLLNNAEQRDEKILHTSMLGFDINHMLQVEYCETRNRDGFYRKYSAFRFGDQIIPGHIVFDKSWIAKDGNPPDAVKKQEIEKYLKKNTHTEKLFEIFELAGINYGRIDYSMLGNSIQTWEINTNPILIKPRKEYDEEIVEIKVRLAKRLEAGLLAMDYSGEMNGGVKERKKISLQWHAKKYFF